jgi:Protein of unknown function (DUF1656)
MSPFSLAASHTTGFFGFYLPPLLVWGVVAIVPWFFARWLLDRIGFYRFVWQRSLFNLALYVLIVGGVMSFGAGA